MVEGLARDVTAPDGSGSPRWWVRRWAAPVGLALAVAGSVGAVGLAVGGEPPGEAAGPGDYRPPRFVLTADADGQIGADGRVQARQGGAGPWFQVRALQERAQPRLVESVRAPSGDGGYVVALVEGPGDTFVAVSTRPAPCESRIYRFRLTQDGHVTGLTRVKGGVVPALVAGVAVSPDGRRIAYATAPCAQAREAAAAAQGVVRPARGADASVTVLDTRDGKRRTWTARGLPSVVGEIVWARDSRTLGYAVGDVRYSAPADLSKPPPEGGWPRDKIGTVTVHALDTRAGGGDLRGARVLFRSAGPGAVITAVMNPDGRTGYGMSQEGEQPAVTTVLFSFVEGRGMRVTQTIKPEPNAVMGVALGESKPRYACLGGIDAFGRADRGDLVTGGGVNGACRMAWAR
ncbi:hypothetical protein [Actinomadura fibrosa]|uniref:Uncharacterized protein n=1 Tax=Actinomadura fibrosa TaxID=111802 RepID=A0ABW2XIC4_9ACTN|nr:hypothetical protein [Actinomadura fibrosa]